MSAGVGEPVEDRAESHRAQPECSKLPQEPAEAESDRPRRRLVGGAWSTRQRDEIAAAALGASSVRRGRPLRALRGLSNVINHGMSGLLTTLPKRVRRRPRWGRLAVLLLCVGGLVSADGRTAAAPIAPAGAGFLPPVGPAGPPTPDGAGPVAPPSAGLVPSQPNTPAVFQSAEEARNYRVSSGDVLQVIVPGYTQEFSGVYVVGPEGTIQMELINAVEVRGLTVSQIEQRLQEALSRYLRSVAGLSVRVVARRMVIRVLGNVIGPGPKELSKDANVQEALAAAGGLLPGSLLTEIVIRRQQGEWIEEIPVDLKSYLEGFATLPPLQNGDEVFVPKVSTASDIEGVLAPGDLQARGTQGTVEVTGAVNAPGRVALPEDGNVLSVLALAGSTAAGADQTEVRIIRGGTGPVETFDLEAYYAQGGPVPRLRPGDVLYVPPILGAAKVVYVQGAVVQPGPITLPPGGTIQTAIAAAGGPKPEADTSDVRLIRQTDERSVQLSFDLETFLRTGQMDPRLTLQAGDIIHVPQGFRPAQRLAPTVFVYGSVAEPGEKPLTAENALISAIGPTLPTANTDFVRIVRDGLVLPFNLRAYLRGEGPAPPELQPGDIVYVDANRVSVVGAVAQPGMVDLPPEANVVSAMSLAGGATPEADISAIVITRGPNAPEPGVQVVFDAEQYLDNPQQALPPPMLYPGDIVAVPRARTDQRVVYVLGQVNQPGAVAVPQGELSLAGVLAQVGGVALTGDPKRIRILHNVDGEMVPEVVDWQALTQGGGGALPVVRAGDIVMVEEIGGPGRGVMVLGPVGRPGFLPVRDGQTVLDTVGLAGGTLPTADVSHARLITADGRNLPLDLGQMVKRGDRGPVVQEGDILLIAAKSTAPSIFQQLLSYLPFFFRGGLF